MKKYLGIPAALFCAALAMGQENYSTWTYYKNITVNTKATGANVAGDIAGFPLLVRFGTADSAVFAQAGAAGASLRFTKADGITRLKHQIDTWDSTSRTGAVWVLADTIKGNDSLTSMRVYWNKAGAADSSKGSAVFDTTNGYVGVWHLGNAAGSNPRPNAIAGRHDATPVYFAGDYAPRAGAIGFADSLVGGNATIGNATPYLKIDSGTASTYYNFPNGTMTYSVWAYPVKTLANARFLEMVSAAPNIDRIWLGWNGNAATLSLRWANTAGGGSGSSQSNNPTTTLAVNTWHNVAFTINRGTRDTSRVYLNGVQIGNAFAGASGNGVPDVARNFVYLGRDFEGTGDTAFAGKLDEAKISNVTRSADWIKLEFESQRPTGSSALTLGPTIATSAPVTAPIIAYTAPAAYTVGTVITTLNVASTGGAVTSYAITPNLTTNTGLTFNTTSGAISGTPTTAQAAATYTVIATGTGGLDTATVSITVRIAVPVLAYTPGTVVDTTTKARTHTPTLTGTVTSCTSTPTLPVGLAVNNTTCVISGTPTAVTAAANYNILASNSTGSDTAVINITVVAAIVGINPGGTVIHMDGSAKPYSFRIPEGALQSTEKLTLSISDAWGRTVWSKTVNPAADKVSEVSWNGVASNGHRVSAGMYIVRIAVLNGGKTTEILQKSIDMTPAR